MKDIHAEDFRKSGKEPVETDSIRDYVWAGSLAVNRYKGRDQMILLAIAVWGILGLILAFLLPDTRMPWLLTVYTLVCGPVVWLWIVVLTARRKE